MTLSLRKTSAAIAAACILFTGVTACSSDENGGEKVATDSATKASDKDAKKDAPKKKVDDKNVSAEYKEALKYARIYVDTQAYSEKGLYDLLTSTDGNNYSPEAAQYAMEQLGDVDWNEQALKMAQRYVAAVNYSKKSLIEQLTNENFEKFTLEQAQYAADHVKADWKKMALNSAKSHKDAGLDDEMVLETLNEDGYTEEEAQYAMEHLND